MRRCYWEPKRVNPADEGYERNAGSSCPDRAEAMATGDSSSMATPSSDERGKQGLPAVPGSRDGRIGLEVVSAAGGGGPLLHRQAHQEVEGGGSGLELVPSGQPKVFGPRYGDDLQKH